jgi:hypothetical protein
MYRDSPPSKYSRNIRNYTSSKIVQLCPQAGVLGPHSPCPVDEETGVTVRPVVSFHEVGQTVVGLLVWLCLIAPAIPRLFPQELQPPIALHD